MISKRIQKAMEGNSAIRAMFVEGKAMAEQYGAENVYDFSLGNPATPAPAAVNDAIRELLDKADAAGAAGSLALHGYMENSGYEAVRAKIAENTGSMWRILTRILLWYSRIRRHSGRTLPILRRRSRPGRGR